MFIPKSIADREALVEQGILRTDRTDDGKLAIYTYTDKCVFAKAWDEITLKSRGHIFDVVTGECVAYPFPKFFNLNENEYSHANLFDWSQSAFYEKLDGWLGVLYRHNGKFKVASRGSFHSTGALWATEWIQKLDQHALDRSLFGCMTLVFEIIEPGHRIILDHGEARLVVLAAYDHKNGVEVERQYVEALCQAHGLEVVQRHDTMNYDRALEIAKTEKGREGLVVRFADGRRVKIKTDWYMNIARFMQRLSPIAVWENMKGGKVNPDWLTAIPPELTITADEIIREMEGQYKSVLNKCEEYSTTMFNLYGNDRKQIALNQTVSRGTPQHSSVFALLDRRYDKVDKIIMDVIYPKGNQYAEVRE